VEDAPRAAGSRMSFRVYVLRCADGSYYTGHTDNLEKRIGEHRSGLISGYTCERLPVELVFSEEFQTREDALSVELQIKGWTRRKKEALIRGDWDGLKRLAKKDFSRSSPSIRAATRRYSG
jgi:predicted GIY-YIG superfamily endonuclease